MHVDQVMRVERLQKDKIPTLKEIIRKVYVVRYGEDTSALQAALTNAGFAFDIVTKNYTETEFSYASICRGLLTHAEAWRRIASGSEPALVVEADFVPCVGFERFSLPHPDPSSVWCWLYTGTSVAYELVDGRYMRGHAASPVATVIYPRLASLLLRFVDEQFSTKNPTEYIPWDSYVDYWVRAHSDIETYLAFRSFGEHGGRPDPIHAQNRLHRTHRADCLVASLAFMPPYAEGSQFKLLTTRLIAKLKAFAKVLLLRRIDRGAFRGLTKQPPQLWQFLRYEFSRLWTVY